MGGVSTIALATAGAIVYLPCHAERGCSSGVEHNLAKVGVVGSNPIARSKPFAPIVALSP